MEGGTLVAIPVGGMVVVFMVFMGMPVVVGTAVMCWLYPA